MKKEKAFNTEEQIINAILIENLQLSTERYIEAEQIILEYINSNWLQRMFFGNRFFEFICERLTKYKF
jgi:hypothetical protein